MYTVKEIMENIEKLRDEYNSLLAVISDDFKDDYVDKALIRIDRLQKVKKEIEYMENLEVKTYVKEE